MATPGCRRSIVAELRGSAGQSFGAWLLRGLSLRLVGQANDYVGKGLAGGEIVIRPPEDARYVWHHNVILGNTALYGATGGELYAAGRRASASPCATPARGRWSRAWAITAAST